MSPTYFIFILAFSCAFYCVNKIDIEKGVFLSYRKEIFDFYDFENYKSTLHDM